MSAGGVNRAILVGHVVSGPQSRTTKAGVVQTIFDLVTVESWYDRETNARREKSIRHRIVAYGPIASTVSKIVRKGARLFVEGQIETRRWKDRNGQPTENWTVEIIVSGWSGQITVLDFHDGQPASVRPDGQSVSVRTQLVDDDHLVDAPTPLSIKRSHSKYGDNTDDTNTSGLSRFLSTSADNPDRRSA